MKSIVIRIEEDEKANDLIRFLKDINYIDVEEENDLSINHETDFESLGRLAGLWRGRDITLSDLRKGAWANRGVKDDTA